jgi:spermidine synthase
VAAAYLGGTVLVAERVANWCLDFQLAAGSLLASALLFFVPLGLLAMVGPFFVRVVTVAVTGVGGNVGRLTALSTLGSFGGTLLIGYVLIPHCANSTTMWLTSGTLAVVAAVYFVLWGRRPTARLLGTGAALLALAPGSAGLALEQRTTIPGWREIYRANSNFGRLQVLERTDGSLRYYFNDYLAQNTYAPATKRSMSLFTYALHEFARGYRPNPTDVLCIGLGIGIVPMQFAREGARVQAVEINPAVLPMAERFFDFDRSKIALAFDDGRHFLNRDPRHYDAIVLDAFLGDSSPAHLMSREAFTAMQRRLKPGGVLVMNTFGDNAPGRNFFSASLAKTLATVFRQVRVHAAGNGNVFLVAGNAEAFTLPPEPPLTDAPAEVQGQLRSAWTTHLTFDPSDGLVLTDDYNPADYFDAHNRELFRQNMARSLRGR